MALNARDPDEGVVVRASTKCVTRVIAGETLIVPVAGGVADLEAIFTLNEVGSRIWTLLETPVSLQRLVDVIEAEYTVPRDEAARDVAEFLDTLRSAGLLGSPDKEGARGDS
jgi:hypothetical protein